MSISWPLERNKDRKLKKSMTRWEYFKLVFAEWALSIALSIVLALAASFISILTAWLSTLREGYCQGSWYTTRKACSTWVDWPSAGAQFIIYITSSCAYAMIAAFITLGTPASAMSGIPELYSYFQGFQVSSVLDKRVILLRALGVGFVSASGLWLGHEAPSVYIFGAIAAVFSHVLPISEARVRDISLAVSATGISVAFSAPLTGVVFALEVFLPSKQLIWRIFVCSVVSTVLLRSVIAQSSGIGGLTTPEAGLFRIHYDRVWNSIELLPFALLGVLGGLYGSAVGRIAALTSSLYARVPVLCILTISLVTATLGYFTSVSRLPSAELLVELFAECRNDSTRMFCKDTNIGGLVYTLILGCVLMPISITLPVPSGFLFPSLVIGALMGRVLGLGVKEIIQETPGVLKAAFCPDELQHCITPGVYALVGAGAVLTGVSRLSITSVVLAFEMTGGLSFIVPVMMGVVVSHWVAESLGKSPGLLNLGAPELLPILPDFSATIPDLYAKEIMVPASSVVSMLRDSQRHQLPFPSCQHQSLPVLGPEGDFIELITVYSRQIEPTVVLSPHASLERIISVMKQMGVRTVVLCVSGKFQGIITRKDVISVLRKWSKPVITASDAAEFEIDSD